MDKVKIMPTAAGGHPVVYGEWMGAGKSAPTIMIYGHYDVQPVDPIELWSSDPFKAEVRGDYLFGRGGSDMKGQVMASLKAVEAIIRTTGNCLSTSSGWSRAKKRSARSILAISSRKIKNCWLVIFV
jgi:acetylornithine deacetylase/succinyl-diaminopimelate desuccinylase-like protein